MGGVLLPPFIIKEIMKLKKFTLVKKSGVKLEKSFDVDNKELISKAKSNGWIEVGAKPKSKPKKKASKKK